MATFEDIALDENGNFILAPDGDALTITDANVVIQDVADELMTYITMLAALGHDKFGGRLQEFIKSENTLMNTNALLRETMAVVKRHPNVVGESVQVALATSRSEEFKIETKFSISINGQIITPSGPLVIIISPEGVRVYEA